MQTSIWNEYLDASYQEMAADEDREREALMWSEALVGDAKED
jgi:hypothetical protein